MTASVIVAGGNGRLGRRVLAALAGRGVAGVRRRDGDGNAVEIDGTGYVDPVRLAGCTVIINCAGRVTGTPSEIDEANVGYAVALARRAREAGVERFIQVSSFSVYGRVECIDEASALAPKSDYGRSKLAAERALAELANDTFRVVSLRLPFMFSAAEPALIGKLVATMRRFRVLPVPSGAQSRRSMISYDGAADALVALSAMPEITSTAIAAADPQPLELVTLARAVQARFGERIAILPVPTPLASLGRSFAPGIVDRLLRSSVLSPAVNPLSTEIRHTVADELDRYLDRLAS